MRRKPPISGHTSPPLTTSGGKKHHNNKSIDVSKISGSLIEYGAKDRSKENLAAGYMTVDPYGKKRDT